MQVDVHHQDLQQNTKVNFRIVSHNVIYTLINENEQEKQFGNMPQLFTKLFDKQSDSNKNKEENLGHNKVVDC